MSRQIDLDTIEDDQELRAMRGDEFMRREEAQQIIMQVNSNISAINTRLAHLLNETSLNS